MTYIVVIYIHCSYIIYLFSMMIYILYIEVFCNEKTSSVWRTAEKAHADFVCIKCIFHSGSYGVEIIGIADNVPSCDVSKKKIFFLNMYGY